MVLQKRLDYGCNGYQVPFVPRAPRSARKRGSIRKKVDDNPMCSIDLLATIAGKILLEGEISPTASNTLTGKDLNSIVNPNAEIESKQEENLATKESKLEENLTTKESKLEENLATIESDEINIQAHNQVRSSKESPVSVITTSVGVEKVVTGKIKDETEGFNLKVEVGSYGNMSIGTRADMSNSEDDIGCDSFPLYGEHLKIVSSRDDDENSSGCTHPITSTKHFRASPRIGDRRIRKVLASKCWKPKLAPRLKEEDISNSSGELNPIYHIRKTCYKRQRSQRNYPFKKRRLFGSNYGRGISSGGISFTLEKGMNHIGYNSGSKIYGATGTSASAARKKTLQSRDSRVKLRIKSFRVPELFIEISETATVGSLKRRVMEAVMDILGGGLRVGVLLQGKKVRDDNKTLLQTGISLDNQLDALGFALEPNSSKSLSTTPSLLPPIDVPEPITRYLPPSDIVCHGTDVLADLPTENIVHFMESDLDSASSPTDMSMVKNITISKALVPVPAMNMEALALVPMHRKSKRSDASQRRIRRPFCVSEVEALVHAVEKLGTGRWRDVKLRAFDNAKHRTYVDLKDKWKTLVHTARISPQQRRGEPVPQELLDRVLAAHAYWTQQQAKLQLKNQSETCLLL